MAASTADRNLASTKVVDAIPYGVADNVHVYLFTCTCTDSSGWLNMAADTSGFVYAGVAYESVDNTVTGHTAGGLTCKVRPPGNTPEDRYLVLDASSPSQSWVGSKVYFTDDHTVALSSTNSILAGRVVQLLSTGSGGKVVVDTLRVA